MSLRNTLLYVLIISLGLVVYGCSEAPEKTALESSGQEVSGTDADGTGASISDDPDFAETEPGDAVSPKSRNSCWRKAINANDSQRLYKIS